MAKSQTVVNTFGVGVVYTNSFGTFRVESPSVQGGGAFYSQYDHKTRKWLPGVAPAWRALDGVFIGLGIIAPPAQEISERVFVSIQDEPDFSGDNEHPSLAMGAFGAVL